MTISQQLFLFSIFFPKKQSVLGEAVAGMIDTTDLKKKIDFVFNLQCKTYPL